MIIVLYLLLDNFFISSFSLMYTPSMLIGWLFIIPNYLITIAYLISDVVFEVILAVCSFFDNIIVI